MFTIFQMDDRVKTSLVGRALDCRAGGHGLDFRGRTITQPRSQGSLLPVPTERERERPWLGLVTWSQNKINSEGGVLCLSIFLSGSF